MQKICHARPCWGEGWGVRENAILQCYTWGGVLFVTVVSCGNFDTVEGKMT